MVYNQALLNNLYHDIKKYKDIKVLVEGGKEAQTCLCMGWKEGSHESVYCLNHEHYAFYEHL